MKSKKLVLTPNGAAVMEAANETETTNQTSQAPEQQEPEPKQEPEPQQPGATQEPEQLRQAEAPKLSKAERVQATFEKLARMQELSEKWKETSERHKEFTNALQNLDTDRCSFRLTVGSKSFTSSDPHVARTFLGLQVERFEQELNEIEVELF